MNDALTDVLLELFVLASSSIRQRAAEAAKFAAEFLRPAEELELTTPDGRRFTGVAVMHEGVVLALLASETPRSRRQHYRQRDYVPDWDEGYYE